MANMVEIPNSGPGVPLVQHMFVVSLLPRHLTELMS